MKGWVIPPEKNSEFVANMERVLDVYKRPYNADYPVICMDESPKQLIADAQPSMPIKPGQEARMDYEYVRHGVANIFMANEPLQGKRLVSVTEFKTKKDWAMFVKSIAEDEQYAKAIKITLVMDNFKTHAASAFYETFEPDEAKKLWDRFEFVSCPKTRQLAQYGRNRIARAKRPMPEQAYLNNRENQRRNRCMENKQK